MLYIIRHAETTHNTEGRIRGMDDPGLTAKGKSEAASVGKMLNGKVDRVVTDGMKRTEQTAKIAFPNHTPEIDRGLTTLHVGNYSGKKQTPQIEKEFNENYVAHPGKKIPGGEAVKDWLPRIKSTYEKYLGQSKHENIALVTHGRPFKAVLNGFKADAAREGGVPHLASVVKVGQDRKPRDMKAPNSNPAAPAMKLSKLARA